MKSHSVHYKFSQHFDFAAEEAYRWCTDYDADDIRLSGGKGERRFLRINEDTLILTDAYFTTKGKVIKRRLVRLYPENHSWTNTRISAVGRYSQFLYRIIPEARGSRLEFTGSEIHPGRKPPQRKLAALAKKLTEEDVNIWRNLAKAMREDLGGRRTSDR